MDKGSITNLRFLVVEDHSFQRLIFSSYLEAWGAQYVLSAGDGREGLDILKGREPPVDIVITDLDMPGMDGLEFIRHLGLLHYPASLIVASGMEESVLNLVNSMAQEYGVPLLGVLRKPVTEKKLRETVEAWRKPGIPDTVRLAQFALEDVAEGLKDGRFIPFFQPQVNLKTGRMKAVEALARWRHPQFGVVRPEAFMEAIEASPLIEELTWVMLRHAVTACAHWNKVGIPAGVSVNVSPTSLQDLAFADRLLQLVRERGLEPGSLVIEVMESAAAEVSAGPMLENFGRLRMRGFGLSIDHFGTGHSSLERLAKVPFTELKIDRTFVTNSIAQAPSRAMLESSLYAAKRMGITSIAEGVENQAEWELVRSLQCDLAQGYYVARPMEAYEVIDWAASPAGKKRNPAGG